MKKRAVFFVVLGLAAAIGASAEQVTIVTADLVEARTVSEDEMYMGAGLSLQFLGDFGFLYFGGRLVFNINTDFDVSGFSWFAGYMFPLTEWNDGEIFGVDLIAQGVSCSWDGFDIYDDPVAGNLSDLTIQAGIRWHVNVLFDDDPNFFTVGAIAVYAHVMLGIGTFEQDFEPEDSWTDTSIGGLIGAKMVFYGMSIASDVGFYHGGLYFQVSMGIGGCFFSE